MGVRSEILRGRDGPAAFPGSLRELPDFPGRILEQYLAMSADFKFLVIDASEPIEAQQKHCARPRSRQSGISPICAS